MEDFDSDLLPTYIEFKLGTDPFKNDTDVDGLSDTYEYMVTGTSPIKDDTDGNGVKDGAEDSDNDQLTNLQEQGFGSYPLYDDTDGDNLRDGDEVNLYHTNPSNNDLDDDGLNDDVEIAMGTNPNLKDSDSDGIFDAIDPVNQQFENTSLDVSVQALGTADLQNTFEIKADKYPYAPLEKLPGVVSDIIIINGSSGFGTGTVRISYSESRLNGSDELNLKLFYFDETEGIPVKACDQQLDTFSDCIEATIDQLGVWFIADNSDWVALSDAQQDESGLMNSLSVEKGILDEGGHSQSLMMTSEPVMFNLNDVINISATVYNNGNVDATGTVLVNFYEGDPTVNGTLIGNATIAGGIPQNGSATAVLCGYVINSSSVNIFVKIDPYNNITERDESNNVAHKVLSIGPQNMDSDDDGLADAEELGGMCALQSQTIVTTDPYCNDTDEDGLLDGLEMGARVPTSGDYPCFRIVSYPDRQYSDDDSLSDYEELQSHTIYLTTSRSQTNNLFDAIESGAFYSCADPNVYFTAVNDVTSNPLKVDTDGDGIWDDVELDTGTRPDRQDSDGDNIPDNIEAGYGEDATLYDVSSPVVTVKYVDTYPLDLFNLQYRTLFTVEDPSGVNNIDIKKNGALRQHINGEGSTYSAIFTMFDSNVLETIIDNFGTTRVDIFADDMHGTGNSTLAYHRPSVVGQWTAWLTPYSPNPDAFAGDMGMASGCYNAVKEIPDGTVYLCAHPIEFIDGIKTLSGAIASLDPDIYGEMGSSMVQAVVEEQELENPYDPNTQASLHAKFEAGWYTGYITIQVAMLAGTCVAVGGVVVRGASVVIRWAMVEGAFAADVTSATAKVAMLVELLKSGRIIGMTERVATGLVLRASEASQAGVTKVVGAGKTAAAKARAAYTFLKTGITGKALAEAHPGEFSQLVARTPGDAASFIDMYAATIDEIWSIEDLIGVQSTSMEVMRVNLAQLCIDGKISTFDTATLITNLRSIDGVSGLAKLIKRIKSAKTVSNINGAAFEADRAAFYRAEFPNLVIEIEPITRIDLRVGNQYIELKSSNGALSELKIEQYVDSAQVKLGSPEAINLVGDNPTKLGINARDGVIGLDNNGIKNCINTHIENKYLLYQFPNYIDEIEILLHDGTSLRLIRESTGLFDWA